MITEQMTLAEIAKEIRTDSIHFDIESEFRQVIKRLKKYKITNFEEVIERTSTKHNNKYHILLSYNKELKDLYKFIFITVPNRKLYGKKTLLTMTYVQPNVLHHVFQGIEDCVCVFQTNHFFNRYAERLNLSDLDRIEKISHYVLNQNFSNTDYHEYHENGNQLITMFSQDGVGLGEYNKADQYKFLKTFVSRELYYDTQKESSINADRSIDSLIENEIKFNNLFD